MGILPRRLCLCDDQDLAQRKTMKSECISVLQRKLLHRLLHRDLRQCTSSALTSAQRIGWVFGLAGGYELTERGRQVAEYSEQADPRGPLEMSGVDEVEVGKRAGPSPAGFGDRSGKGKTGGQFHVQAGSLFWA